MCERESVCVRQFFGAPLLCVCVKSFGKLQVTKRLMVMSVCAVLCQAAGNSKTNGYICMLFGKLQVTKSLTVMSVCAVVWQTAGDKKTDSDVCVCSCLASCRQPKRRFKTCRRSTPRSGRSWSRPSWSSPGNSSSSKPALCGAG